MLATEQPYWWVGVYAVLFAIGRIPTVANGLNLVDKQPINPARDGWESHWITWIAIKFDGLQTYVWAFLRVFSFYLPLFFSINLQKGALFCAAYGLCWVSCYALAKPFLAWIKSTRDPATIAEWVQVTLFAGILGLIV
jgi:hypothetical protein